MRRRPRVQGRHGNCGDRWRAQTGGYVGGAFTTHRDTWDHLFLFLPPSDSYCTSTAGLRPGRLPSGWLPLCLSLRHLLVSRSLGVFEESCRGAMRIAAGCGAEGPGSWIRHFDPPGEMAKGGQKGGKLLIQRRLGRDGLPGAFRPLAAGSPGPSRSETSARGARLMSQSVGENAFPALGVFLGPLPARVSRGSRSPTRPPRSSRSQ